MALLTAIVPIGPKHRENNLISQWSEIANTFSRELKIIIIEDFGTDLKTNFCPLIFELSNMETVCGNFNSPGRSRNMGLSMANSKWVSFWDADDVPNVVNFIEMVKFADSSKYDIAVGKFSKFSNFIGVSREDYKNNDLKRFLFEPGLWRMSFRLNSLKNNKFENLSMGEDQLFLLDLEFYKKHIYFYQDVVYKYQTKSPFQLTNSEAVNQIVQFLNLVRLRLEKNTLPTDYIAANMISKIIMTGLVRTKWRNKSVVVCIYLRIARINIRFAIKMLRYAPLIGCRIVRKRLVLIYK
jgi:glycosyltransferase involved in cell wall biosynthesis